MAVDPQVARDLTYILARTYAVGNVLDELALLRIAVRKYAEIGNAEDAVAWAAKEMSEVISRTRKPPNT